MVKCSTPHCKNESSYIYLTKEMCEKCWHNHCVKTDKQNEKKEVEQNEHKTELKENLERFFE
jgi:hypothetical protein